MCAKSQFYIGLGVGTAFITADLNGNELDESSTVTTLTAGYRFNRYFALEAGLYNIAEASVGSIVVPPSTTPVSASADLSAVGINVVGLYPLSKKSDLFLKLGVANWDGDIQVNTSIAENDGSDLLFGLGASYSYTKNVAVQAEWNLIDSDNPELSMLILGFKFGF